jgi:hypothetical protein
MSVADPPTSATPQQLALMIVPKFAASLSFVGSSMIVSQVLQSKTNRSNPQQRIVLAMSCIDLSVSSVWLATNFMIPPWSTDYYYAIGNQATCSLQGFVVQMSIGGVLYNASLALYYVLVIKLQWQNHQIKKLEPYMHAFPILFGLGTAVTGLALRLYNPASWDCWIAAHPPDCSQSYMHGEDADCLRGDNADIYQWAFFFGPLWLCIILITIAMVTVCMAVRKVETKVQKWRMTPTCTMTTTNNRDPPKMEQTRQIAIQSLLYVGAFYVTWFWPTLARIVQLTSTTIPDWLVTLAGSFIPIQGFFNALVYFRPRYNKCSRQNAEHSRWWVVKTIFRQSLCCCLPTDIRYNRKDGRDIEGVSTTVAECASSSEVEGVSPIVVEGASTSAGHGTNSATSSLKPTMPLPLTILEAKEEEP